jgi:TfoX/Sxy family transcriptional regulator of competence genes
MAANPDLMKKVRSKLATVANVQEKRMFSGVAFMVNGKMCVTVGEKRMMFRIDPAIHDESLKRKGSRTVEMRGRAYRGFVYVDQDGLERKKDFDDWIALALDFNQKAKASKKKKK